MPIVNLQQVDGALVLTVPEEIVDRLHLVSGASIDLSIVGSGLIGREVRPPKYNLDDLLDRTDPLAFERTEEDWEWLNSSPVGRELI